MGSAENGLLDMVLRASGSAPTVNGDRPSVRGAAGEAGGDGAGPD